MVPYVDDAGEERCFEYVCAGIWQDVVLSIPSGWWQLECWLDDVLFCIA